MFNWFWKLLANHLKKQRDKEIRKWAEKQGIPEPEIENLHVENGNIDIQFKHKHPGMAMFIDEIVKFFEEEHGINYVSMAVAHPEKGWFDVIVQKRNGKSMAEVNSELKEEIRRLNDKVYSQQSTINSLENQNMYLGCKDGR